MKIVTDVKKLGKRAEEINIKDDNERIQKIITKIKKALETSDLLALSAPQVNSSSRIFCMKFRDEIKCFINPMITKVEGLHFAREFSPSIPDKEFIVPRNDKILVMYQKPTGVPEENMFEGVAAELFQQQINLLDGVLISDFGLEVLPEFDIATEEEKAAVLEAYAASLKVQNEQLQGEIKSDKLLSKTAEAIEFMKSVAAGETKIERPEPKLNRVQRRALEKLQQKMQQVKKTN